MECCHRPRTPKKIQIKRREKLNSKRNLEMEQTHYLQKKKNTSQNYPIKKNAKKITHVTQ